MSEAVLNLNDNQAFVAFRRPGEKDFYLSLGEVTMAEMTESNIERFDYVVMPFISNLSLNAFFKFTQIFLNRAFSFVSNYETNYSSIEEKNYYSDVNKAINLMRTSDLNKVVYSRTKSLPNDNSDLGKIFIKLQKKYPSAYTFIYNIPGVGCWVGATPELLIMNDDKGFKTVALAGTQTLPLNIENIAWGQKEIDEQAFIKDFVKKGFDDLGVSFSESLTKTKAAGKMCHLYTEYIFENPNSISDIIKYLHPGPAISGSPKQQAIKAIEALENHERKYYTGYLGELKKGHLELYINLRSMEVLRDKFLLYIGGGITSDSTAVNEWNETELKAKTMEAIIN